MVRSADLENLGKEEGSRGREWVSLRRGDRIDFMDKLEGRGRMERANQIGGQGQVGLRVEMLGGTEMELRGI